MQQKAPTFAPGFDVLSMGRDSPYESPGPKITKGPTQTSACISITGEETLITLPLEDTL